MSRLSMITRSLIKYLKRCSVVREPGSTLVGLASLWVLGTGEGDFPTANTLPFSSYDLLGRTCLGVQLGIQSFVGNCLVW